MKVFFLQIASASAQTRMIVAMVSILSVSCVNTKKATYFNNLSDAELSVTLQKLEPLIQANDLLSITVSSLNPEASQIFNTPNTSASSNNVVSANGITPAIGYLVGVDGNIAFPILGTLKAAGLTKLQLMESIVRGIKKKDLLLDPIVTIRYLNFRVSVLGEVAHPTVVIAPAERISMLEAIAQAGDLTLYARRDNVLLLREREGKRIVKHINLNDQELLNSPYYYLEPNDIVYVAPNTARVASTSRSNQWLPIAFSAASLAAIIIDRFISK